MQESGSPGPAGILPTRLVFLFLAVVALIYAPVVRKVIRAVRLFSSAISYASLILVLPPTRYPRKLFAAALKSTTGLPIPESSPWLA